MKQLRFLLKRLKIAILPLALLCSGMAIAQNSTVSGTVIDDYGMTIPGVTVVLKSNTSVGTITDIDGNFSISVSSDDALVFSFIGMATQEIAVAGKSTINVTMLSDASELEEMVVVGYGSQKKATLTGSVEQVKADVFESNASSNPAVALQGQTPGLVVTRTSSNPTDDDAIDFSIRGTNSVNGGSPLILIDGIATLGNTAFTSMSADDIESITVLKDASAAIYGSRASNGVILVTTKKGKGEVKVNISSLMKINTIGITPPLCSTPQEFGQQWIAYIEQDELAGLTASPWAFTKEQYQWLADGNTGYMMDTKSWGDIYIGDNYDYNDLYGSSFSQQHNASVSGGSEASDFRVSAGYVEDMGAIKPTYDGKKQFNVRANYNFDVNKWLRFETSTSYFNRYLDSPSYAGWRAFTQDPPLFPIMNPMGQWSANFGYKGGAVNPVAQMVDGGRTTNRREEFRLKGSAIFTITKNLNFRIDAAVNRAWQRKQSYELIVPTYSWSGRLANKSINTSSYISEASNEDKHETYQGMFDYNKKFGAHTISALAGMTAEKRTRKTLTGKRIGFEDLGLYDLNLGSVETEVTATGGASNWGLASYIGRLNYDFQSKYLFELQFRRDGSSKFADGYKWRNFGGGSLGWVLSEESILKDNAVIDFLKLRVSYGQLGNQGGIGNHDYASTLSNDVTYFGQQSLGMYTTTTANVITTNERSWETIKTTNFGVDFRLLDNRLSATGDYFISRNEDMLISVTYPAILGGSPKTTNSGTLETKGWEFQLGWNDRIGEVQYNISANMSDTRNILVSMGGKDTWYPGRVSQREGYALNTFFLYKTDGLFSSQDEATAYLDKYTSGTSTGDLASVNALRAGDVRVVDVDGNGYISAQGDGVNDAGDLVDCGDATPHYVYGINLGVKWRNWDVSTFFQGVLEHKVLRSGQSSYPRQGHFSNQNTAFNGLTWTPDNTSAELPRMTTLAALSGWNYAPYKNPKDEKNYSTRDFMLMSGRYIRCKSLVLGYTFNDLQVRNSKISKLRVYFTGSDLFEFTNMDAGWDPEFGSSADSSYPFMRTWALGLNITL